MGDRRVVRRAVPAGLALGLVAATSACSPSPVASGAAEILVVRRAEPAGTETAGRTFIALAGDEGDELHILAEELWSASSPAPSFDASRILLVGRRSPEDAAALWETRAGGGSPRLVTRGLGDPGDPDWLPDGRVIWSDVVPGAPAGVRALYGAGADGTDVRQLTFGRHEDSMPGVLADGRVLFVRRYLDGRRSDGSIMMTIHPDGSGPARFYPDLSTVRPARPAAASSRNVRLDGYEVLQVVGLFPFEQPPALTSVLKEEAATGTLLCLDVYESMDAISAGLPEGSVTGVIVSRDRPSAEAPGDGNGYLGQAPVHPDGSFLVEVPADTPLRLELIGSDGAVLAASSSGIWVRPNENRGCVGCHEPPDQAPENRRPMAVLSMPVRALGDPLPDEGNVRAAR